MKKTFACGHTGKGQFCHACAALAKETTLKTQARNQKRLAKQLASEGDPIDLSIANHLIAIQTEAREIIGRVNTGTHPLALRGKRLQATAGRVLSVPVGRSYRLLFDADTLRPLEFMTHERYNAVIDRRLAA
jgi:hypothetical protein